MKVNQVMIRSVAVCTPQTNLADAAWTLWERDCGALPVVVGSKIVGMITDRDIAIAAATKDRPAREIAVQEVIGPIVHACHEEDDVEAALEIMGREQVRRLPVVDDEDSLTGIVSMNDLIRRTGRERGRAPAQVSSDEVLSALRGISRHRREDEGNGEIPTRRGTEEARPATRASGRR